MARPTKYPEWATTTVVDPIQKTPNIIEPPDQKKEVGWQHEYPPYQYLNWLANTTFQWIVYFDQEIANIKKQL